MKVIKNEEKLTQVDLKILQYFSRNENNFSLAADIAHSSPKPLHVGNVRDSCEDLCKKGILERKTNEYVQGKGRGFKPQYRLNQTFESLKFIFLNLPDDKSISLLMACPFYAELLPQIIEFFEKGLQDLGYNPFNLGAKKIIEECLKVSPSCLKFVLNQEKYQSAKDNFEKLYNLFTGKIPNKDKKNAQLNTCFKDSSESSIFVNILLIKIPDDIIEDLIPENEFPNMIKLLNSHKKTLVSKLSYNFRIQVRDVLNKSLE